MSLSVETCQLFTRNRTTALADVLMNSIGALIGGAMAAVFFRSPFQRLLGFVRWKLSQQPAVLILCPYLFLLVLDSVVPFDVSIEMSNVKTELTRKSPLTPSLSPKGRGSIMSHFHALGCPEGMGD